MKLKLCFYATLLSLTLGMPSFVCHSFGNERSKNDDETIEQEPSKTMRYFFQIYDFINLETTQESLISSIKKAVSLKGFWHILDQDGVVYQFDHEGRFIRHVGGIGQGPGEYLMAEDIQRIFDNRLAIYDGRAVALMIYSAEGDFIEKINLREWFPGRFPSMVLWDKPEQMILVGCHGLTRKKPINENWVYHIENNKPKLVTSFNTNSNEITMHFETIQAKYTWTCAAIVKENLWIGSPYSAKIGIYDQGGKLIKMVGRKHTDQIQEDDVLKLDINKRSDNSILFSAARNMNIVTVNHLVVAPVISNGLFKTDLFSTAGELLASGLDSTPLYILLGGGEGHLIYSLPSSDNPDAYKDRFTEKEYNLLTSKGFDPDAAAGQNSWLILAKPIQ